MLAGAAVTSKITIAQAISIVASREAGSVTQDAKFWARRLHDVWPGAGRCGKHDNVSCKRPEHVGVRCTREIRGVGQWWTRRAAAGVSPIPPRSQPLSHPCPLEQGVGEFAGRDCVADDVHAGGGVATEGVGQ